MHILVLEASTTSAKAMVYDPADGSSQVVTTAYPEGEPTMHDPDAVVAAVTALGRKACVGKSIAAVALVGAWHGLFLADRQLRPITPVYLWSNTDAAEVCRGLRDDRGLVEWYYQSTGCMVNATYPFFTLLLLKERGLPVGNSMILDEGSYLNWALTGRLVQTRCLASGSGLLNIHRQEYDRDVLAMAGIGHSQLPGLVSSNESFPLSAQGAELLGLPVGTPVLPTNSDGGSNQVGVGALRPGVMTFSVGTSGALRLATDSPRISTDRSTWCYLSPHSWLSGAATAGACNNLDWFRNRVTGGRLGYLELEGRAQVAAPGPTFLPFLYGERCPGWDDQRGGGFVDLKPEHDVTLMYRAVQEGVLFNLHQCYQSLVALNGVPDRVKLSGGILHSARWTQMCADIFGTDLETDDVPHASLLGGAVLGMQLLDVIGAAEGYQTYPARIVSPDPGVAGHYADRYAAYLAAYHRQGALPASAPGLSRVADQEELCS